MFANLLKDSTKRKRPLEIRKQAVEKPSKQRSNGLNRSQQDSRPKLKPPLQKSAHPADRVSRLSRSHRPSVRRARSSSSAIDFGTERSDSEHEPETTRTKKARVSGNVSAADRIIRLVVSGNTDSAHGDHIIHAADIPSLDKTTKYESCFNVPTGAEVEIQYPSSSPQERYALIKPSHDDSAFNAIADIVAVMQTVSEFFVPDHLQPQFDGEMQGYTQRLKRATKKHSLAEFQDVVASYNGALRELLDANVLGKQLDEVGQVPPRLVECVLNQTYARTVSPNLKTLRVYEAGTDNVYGELLPRFVSDILTRDVQMTPRQVFVDLGSGVGNVVFQAALQIGCESWGCEMMEHSCDLADRQLVEFTARCRMWGLSAGPVHLERGDFLANETIKNVLRRADVVLVNNQVFTPALNEALTTLFLDLKDGCTVVSLKSFVPAGYKITERNSENPLNLLSVQAKTYFSNCVSWTSQGGSYYISTKDSGRIQRFRGVVESATNHSA